MQLLKITKNKQGEQLINARELWRFLDVNYDFSTWIKRRIEKYDFIENEDFILVRSFPQNCGKLGGRPKDEYIISMDMAKELAMIENNANGRLARRYFIQCEKKYRKLLEEKQQKELKLLQEKSSKGVRKIGYVLTNNIALRECANKLIGIVSDLTPNAPITLKEIKRIENTCILIKGYAFPYELDKKYGVEQEGLITFEY